MAHVQAYTVKKKKKVNFKIMFPFNFQNVYVCVVFFHLLIVTLELSGVVK